MCVCNPSIRTPYCGKGTCVWPKPEPEVACEVCGAPGITTSNEDEIFEYAIKDDIHTMTMKIPVFHCGVCEISYTDHRAEEIREAAIADVNLLTPK